MGDVQYKGFGYSGFLDELALPFSVELVAQASQCPINNIRTNWPILYKVMTAYGMGSPANCAGVIGTVAKESASTFAPVAEAYWLDAASRERWYKDTSKHAPYSGGWQYYGRGYIQTTHDYNYKAVQDATGLPVLDNPDLLLEPLAASHALCIYWTARNMQAMCEAHDWAAVRKAVYGGNDPDGIERIRRVAQVLGVE